MDIGSGYYLARETLASNIKEGRADEEIMTGGLCYACRQPDATTLIIVKAGIVAESYALHKECYHTAREQGSFDASK